MHLGPKIRQKQSVMCFLYCFLAYVCVISNVDFTWKAPWQLRSQGHFFEVAKVQIKQEMKAPMGCHLRNTLALAVCA